MLKAYLQQLRIDSSLAIVPVFTAVTIGLSVLFITLLTRQAWYLLPVSIAAIVCYQVVRRLLQHDDKQIQAGTIFIGTYLLILTFILGLNSESSSYLPYLYGVFIVLSSTMIQPEASFHTWLLSTLFIFVAVLFNGSLTPGAILRVLLPILFNLCMAVVGFLTTTEWQLAVESVSILQRRAQSRRDELFEMKEEMKSANNRLKYLNKQLDIAHQTAISERDLRTRFMNNVSHELRTPLNAIVNFAHIIRMGGRGTVTELQSDYLQRIETSGWHLLSVLNDLLDMAQIQSGEFKLYLEAVSLETICEEAMANLRGLIIEKEEFIEIIRDYPQEWPVVQVDQIRLKQSLINLLGNAAKYTEEGHIALRVRPEGEIVKIMVEDTGAGIAPEHHALIFQEFRQVDESAARKRIGTGLGLPITKHLIERHGGQIGIESAEGQGSTFIITLPIHNDQDNTQS